MVEDIIAEQIANIMVLPNRIAVPMIEELNLSLLKYPPPEVGQRSQTPQRSRRIPILVLALYVNKTLIILYVLKYGASKILSILSTLKMT